MFDCKSTTTTTHLLQQMAQTAEVLPPERVLRLAQRVQDPPQSRHTDSADCGLHLQEILHRGGESLKILLLLPDLHRCIIWSLTDQLITVRIDECDALFRALVLPWANLCVRHSAVHWPGVGRQLCRDRVARDARTLLRRRAGLHTKHRKQVTYAPTWRATMQAVDPLSNASVSPPPGKAWPSSTMQRKSFTSWGSRTSWRVWSRSCRGLQSSSRLWKVRKRLMFYCNLLCFDSCLQSHSKKHIWIVHL